MAKLTISDIAEMAQVSKTTVSFVINGRDGISEETRNRVLSVIKQTNYTPNVHTRRLTLKKSFTIYVVMQQQTTGLQNLFYMEITFGILRKSKEFGYSIVFASVLDERDEEILAEYIRNKDTDGIIFLQDAEPRILSIVEAAEIPCLVADSHMPDSVSYTQIKVDYFSAAYMATRHLVEKGHEKIAFIGMGSKPDYYVNTFGGYKKALEEANLIFLPDWIQADAGDEQSAYGCMESILRSTDVPTAVFCAGDIFAIGAMKCVKENGLSVPGDISFVGLDDIAVSSYVDPPLTTMSINEDSMGEMAMQVIYDMINKKRHKKVNHTPCQIVERASVRDLSGGEASAKRVAEN